MSFVFVFFSLVVKVPDDKLCLCPERSTLLLVSDELVVALVSEALLVSVASEELVVSDSRELEDSSECGCRLVSILRNSV